jgi:DNA polymerase-3 subunit epsilon
MATRGFPEAISDVSDSAAEENLIARIASGWLPPVFAAIDFETANLHPRSACAVSVVRVEAGRLAEGRDLLINPPPGPFLFTWLHGIRRRDVRSAEGFRSAWSRLLPLFDGACFVAAHNGDFDKKVLEACCQEARVTRPLPPFLCTARMSRRVWSPKRADLPSMCRRLGIPLTHHDPRSDVAACAQIVLAASRLALGGSAGLGPSNRSAA